jgi:hypothetical protein
MVHQSYFEFENYDKIKTTLPLYGIASVNDKGYATSYTRAPLAFGEQPFHFVAHLQEVEDSSNITIYSDVNGDKYVFEGEPRYYTGDNSYLILI